MVRICPLPDGFEVGCLTQCELMSGNTNNSSETTTSAITGAIKRRARELQQKARKIIWEGYKDEK